MALALYRKYRPRTFAEIIGQEHVTEPLSQALRSGRLHHAYLFSGPRGCGKTSSARILARSLNCDKGPTPEPCGECDSCQALAPDGAGSIDVIEIDAASHGGVDDARELRERAFFAPVSSRFKVYVIDEAHMVSSAGFNALLKLVEEPPEYVKFVFATTEPEKVLGTIKSRTHHYPFRLIPPGVLRPYLDMLCKREGVHVEPAVFPLVVRAGGGSARDTLSVLDQLIAGAGAEGVGYARAVALLGVTDVALIDEMCDALAAGDGAAAYAAIDRVAEAGHDPRRFASDLLERLRDLIVLQQVPDAATKGLLDAPEDQLERMAGQAAHLGAATLSRFADIVHNGLTEMRGTTAPRLLLELITARMLLPGADDSTGALLQRLERMERRITAGGVDLAAPVAPVGVPAAAPTAPAAPPASAPSPAPTPVATPRAETPRPEIQRAETQRAEPQRAETPRPETPRPEAPAQSEPEQPAAVRSAPPQSAPPQSAPPGDLDAAGIRRVWPEVMRIVGMRSKRAAAGLREATVRDAHGDTLVLVFKYSVHAEMVTAHSEVVVEALYELLGGRWRIQVEYADGAPAPSGRAPSSGPAVQGGPPAQGPSATAAAPATPVVPSAAPAPAPPPARQATAPGRQATPPARQATTPRGPATGRQVPGRPAAPEARAATTVTDDGWPEAARPGGVDAPPARTEEKPPAPRGPAHDAGWSPFNGAVDEEPPFDPEYDRPGPPRATIEGFDPGDEPLDDGDPNDVRESSEEQALRLLSEHLGAERIGD